ncbi:TIM-barrel protein, putative [Halovenus aranensis]|uniref:TIM-barrel protein, putative n=1 Tax=Halovenus aranensis TaxID=890420 RepID=A0A1G8W8R0_9EURY|nr:tRNA-dihydrouridine synthase [Halovenus aranensis]SDJ74105.1 TIM-barrel protein, putative [Halovenus aranensis]
MTRDPAFDPPVALASLSGQSDAEWAATAAEYAGVAFLGGIAIDEPTRAAARELVERDRTEFLPADPVAFVDDQFGQTADLPIRPGVNVRTTTLSPLAEVAEVCRDHDAILEINAHCRQDEICGAGSGEALLTDTERLCEQVSAASERGPEVSVKVRAEVPGVDLPAVAERVAEAGATYIHLDAMDSEAVVGDVAAATDLSIIANNEVRGRDSVFEYLSHGAAAVSVGRPSDDRRVLSRVREAATDWFERDAQPTTNYGSTETPIDGMTPTDSTRTTGGGE